MNCECEQLFPFLLRQPRCTLQHVEHVVDCFLLSPLSLSLSLSLSFSLSRSLSLRSTCRRSTTATSPGWTIDGPGRAGRQRQASIAASHAPSLAVPCAEERIPRCGRRPAKLIKFSLGLQLVFRKQKKFAQSSPVGLHYVAKSLHLVCNWFSGSEKQFALSLASSLHEIKISLY